MPELAEVETFKRQLEPVLLNQRIVSINLYHQRSTRRHPDKEKFIEEVQGKVVNQISRYGKYLTFHLSSGNYLNVHLRMSGRFLMYESSDFDLLNCPKHSHVVIQTQKDAIVFIDPRTFGEFWLTNSPTPELEKGIDAFDSTEAQVRDKILERSWSKRPIKAILLDQNILSGIGNIYADEILANSKILPSRSISDLSEFEVLKITKACKSVLGKAIDAHGSSLKDESFRDLNGEIGKYQTQHFVHARKKCARCNGEISTTKISGRTTYYCEKCQN